MVIDKTPLVSIIIPTFNRVELLNSTLMQLHNQEYKNFECIIVNDGNTKIDFGLNNEIISDSRFKFLVRPDFLPKGPSSCRSYGFENSVGDYIQFLDDDDYLSKNKISSQIESILNENYGNDIILTCFWDHYWTGKEIELKNIVETEIDSNSFFELMRKKESFLPLHSYLIPRFLIEKAGLWNVNLMFNDDAEFMARVIMNSKKIINCKTGFCYYISHDGARISVGLNETKIKSFIYSLKLISDYAKSKDFDVKKYISSKLKRILFLEFENKKSILAANNKFFNEHNIYLRFYTFYQIKFFLYKSMKKIKKITK